MQDGVNKEKMMILSGHDENVASFIMNFYLQNYQCIIDNFKSSADECFEKIKFSTNVVIEVRREEGEDLKVLIYYNGRDFSYASKTQFTIDEFIRVLQNDRDGDFQRYCVKEVARSKWLYWVLLISLLLAVVLLMWFLKENEEGKGRKQENEEGKGGNQEKLIESTENETP